MGERVSVTARPLWGARIAQEVREAVARAVKERVQQGHRPPCLAAVAVDPDGGALSYLRVQERAAHTVGMTYRRVVLGPQADTRQAVRAVEALCQDPGVDGVFLSWPFPAGVDGEAVLSALDPARDVDAITPASLGRLAVDPGARLAATARAVLALLAAVPIALPGRRVALVGQGRTAGLPLLLALLHRGASVMAVSREDPRPSSLLRQAEVVVTAVGKPGLVGPEDLSPGAVVVDVGTTEVDGKLWGDVQPQAYGRCRAYAPVPGGVGPLTTAYLLANTLEVLR
jgi:methylenetetrahydrofolate dehydrogenase (NADP+)/methenyltetrahydrofolate cyclohydrolase